jgi:hypothetical protein
LQKKDWKGKVCVVHVMMTEKDPYLCDANTDGSDETAIYNIYNITR